MPPRKRKQLAQSTSTAPTPSPTPSTPVSSGSSTPIPTQPSIPWPPHFTTLSKIHGALNLVYTFFTSTRKHVPTTLEALGSAVAARLGAGKKFGIEELAELKAVYPEGVGVGWVDLRGWDGPEGVGGRRGRDDDDDDGGEEVGIKKEDEGGGIDGKMAILVEFLDGEEIAPSGGSSSAKRRKGAGNKFELRTSSFPSQAQMMRLINRRNERFTFAVNNFLQACQVQNLDPVMHLQSLVETKYLPPLRLNGTNGKPPTPPQQVPQPTIYQIPTTRDPIPDILDSLTTKTPYFNSDQILARTVLPARSASHDPPLAFPLSQRLVNALWGVHGITPDKLYSHQTQAANLVVQEGRDIVVATGTGSGKSLCYQLPVLFGLEKEEWEQVRKVKRGEGKKGRAIFVFPTKALAQDQLKGMRKLVGAMVQEEDGEDWGDYFVGNDRDVGGNGGGSGSSSATPTSTPGLTGPNNWRIETYDGDTEMEDRRIVREEARIVLTNPDMLHVGIIPAAGVGAGGGGPGGGYGRGASEGWRRFLKELRFVVVDELHIYNGSFGTHMAFIMRRLRRVCAALGNEDVRFIGCSATIANPVEHMQNLFGLREPPALVSTDGSPCGDKHLVVWQPSLVDSTQSSTATTSNTSINREGKEDNEGKESPTKLRLPATTEAARLITQLLIRGVRTIAFTRSRKQCELLLVLVRTELSRLGVTLPQPPSLSSNISSSADPPASRDFTDAVMSYRGGYSPSERRQIEALLKVGAIHCVVSTSALELGVDIGVLDAVVMVGMPISTGVGGLRQQSGRAGRRGKDSLAVLVGSGRDDPEGVMEREWLGVGGDLKLEITEGREVREQLVCAAGEMPLWAGGDGRWFGGEEVVRKAISRGLEEGELVKGDLAPRIPGMDEEEEENRRTYIPHPRYLTNPARKVNIRSTPTTPSSQAPTTSTTTDPTVTISATGATTNLSITIIDTTPPHPPTILEQSLPPTRAVFELYPGGIYLHMGTPYLVHSVTPTKGIATVVKYASTTGGGKVDWITSPRDHTNVRPGGVGRSRQIALSGGEVEKGKVNMGVGVGIVQGKVDLHTSVYGFTKVDLRGKVLEVVDGGDVAGWSGGKWTLERTVEGVWSDIGPVIRGMEREIAILSDGGFAGIGNRDAPITVAGCVHSAEHAILAVVSSPSSTTTTTSASTLTTPFSYSSLPSSAAYNLTIPCTATPSSGTSSRLIIYDPETDNGSTSSRLYRLYESFEKVVERAIEVVEGCRCGVDTGCMKCLGVVRERGGKCVVGREGGGAWRREGKERGEGEGRVLTRWGAGKVLRMLLGMEVKEEGGA